MSMDMQFDEAYYEAIWGKGGMHRHDFCEPLADQLIAKFNPKSVLDIGTGCGYLVKVLRDKGVDAWGLEISEYAVANSHGHVRQGDVRDIPFGRKFDLVFSQGLWCHVPEEDIDQAWAECKRVGARQEHYIDYEEAPEDIPNFVTRKSEQWWKNRFHPKVLVACPTHQLKEYAFAEWLDCVRNLDYPNYDVLVVDNSPDEEFYNRWHEQVKLAYSHGKMEMVYLPGTDQSSEASGRINASMEVIRKHFLDGDYTWWFNLESDVIVGPEAINLLMRYPSDWTSHGYEVRGGGGIMQGIGCSLLSRSIAEAGRFDSVVHGPDNVLWEQTMRTHKTLSLSHFMDVKHLGNAEGAGG